MKHYQFCTIVMLLWMLLFYHAITNEAKICCVGIVIICLVVGAICFVRDK